MLNIFIMRVSTSLGQPQVPVGLSVGNPQVKRPTDLSSTSVEAGTCHRYLPYLSLNLVQIFWSESEIYEQNVIRKVNQKGLLSELDYYSTLTLGTVLPLYHLLFLL